MASEKMTGAEIVIKSLVDLGVEVVFGYPGGAVLPIYDALFQQNRIRHILVRQEGGAVHAAEGYARSTGKVGVVLVTSGPEPYPVVSLFEHDLSNARHSRHWPGPKKWLLAP